MTDDRQPEAPIAPPPEKPAVGPTKVIRRVHMYLGLFLAPWMLMYALSTLVMAHRPFVLSFYPTETPKITVEKELDYSRSFTTNSTGKEKALVILQDLGLEGRHTVNNPKPEAPLVINRQHALYLRKITLDPKTNKLTVQREDFRALTFLERMHRRRGFQDPYAVENSWAFSVDLTVITMVFWGLSGIWLWWGMRPTRVWGAVSLAVGLGLFGMFLALI